MTAPTNHPALPATSTATSRPTATEISALTAWMRRLSDAGPHRPDPAELAAFSRAKADLLERIERHNHPQPTPCDQPGDSR